MTVLRPDWFDVEMREIDREAAQWPDWLKENFDELQRQIDRDVRLARIRDKAARRR